MRFYLTPYLAKVAQTMDRLFQNRFLLLFLLLRAYYKYFRFTNRYPTETYCIPGQRGAFTHIVIAPHCLSSVSSDIEDDGISIFVCLFCTHHTYLSGVIFYTGNIAFAVGEIYIITVIFKAVNLTAILLK
jgi:hypothetical protein